MDIGCTGRRAFITGIGGQDGGYLAELLAQKGYEVHGFARKGTRLDGTINKAVARLHEGDLTDSAAIRRALHESSPAEIYNLGAQSHVGASFLDPTYTFRVTTLPVFELLEYARFAAARVYQASTSEMFGDATPPQNENSPFRPRSPYAIAKVAAHNAVKLYREAYKVFAVGGILMNHESPRRPESFVTRKITRAVARIFSGQQHELVLGNLEAQRDWGFAGDYVEAMWLMLQQETPKDYVIASGSTHTVREFVELSFAAANSITGQYRDWQSHVKTDPKFERPAEVPLLLGNPTRACEDLGWQPKINFKSLVWMMVEHDLSEIGVSK